MSEIKKKEQKGKPQLLVTNLELEESKTRKVLQAVLTGCAKDTEIDSMASFLNKWGFLFRWYMKNVLKYSDQLAKCKVPQDKLVLQKSFQKDLKTIVTDPTNAQKAAIKEMTKVFLAKLRDFEKVKEQFLKCVKDETQSNKDSQHGKIMMEMLITLDYPGCPADWSGEIEFLTQDLEYQNDLPLTDVKPKEDVFLKALLKIAQNEELNEMQKKLKDQGIKTDRDFIGIGGGPDDASQHECFQCLKKFTGNHFALGRKRFCFQCMKCESCNKILPQKHWFTYQFSRKYDGTHVYRRMCTVCREAKMDRCASCKEQIIGLFYRVSGQLWHKKCMRCHYFKCPFYKKQIEDKYCVRQSIPYHRDCLEEIDENKY